MSETVNTKTLRKGTRSCVECRKQKVRCIWPSADAKTCQRCISRRKNCVAQTPSTVKSSPRQLTSRERTIRLEEQVARLEAAVRSAATEPLSDDSEPESLASAVVTSPPPAHLQSLFENHMLKVNDHSPEETSKHKSITTIRRMDRARKALQRLIPPEEDIIFISGFISNWVSLFSNIFPTLASKVTMDQIVAQFAEMKNPDQDVASLAWWLLSIALSALQTPPQLLQGRSQLNSSDSVRHFAESLRHVMEKNFLSQEGLVGSVSGLQASFIFVQLELVCGRVRKAWLTVQRLVAIAQSMGLPRASHTLSQNPIPSNVFDGTNKDRNYHDLKSKTEMWEAICTIDRVTGMMFNLPATTRWYKIPRRDLFTPEGKVNAHDYLLTVANVAAKIQDLEYFPQTQEGHAEMFSEVLQMDRELRLIASRAPSGWWDNFASLEPVDRLLQLCHCYIQLRAHLPFTLLQDQKNQYAYSRSICLEACRKNLVRYSITRRFLPPVLFISHVIDLQAMTALVVLLLTQEDIGLSGMLTEEAKQFWSLFGEVTGTMKTVAEENDSNFARRVVEAIHSLTAFLQRKDGLGGLTLRVPLIGKIYVQRNANSENNTYTEQQPPPTTGSVPMPYQPSFLTQDPINSLQVSVAPDELTSLQWNSDSLDSMSWLFEDDSNQIPQYSTKIDNFGNPLPDLDLVDINPQPQSQPQRL